MDDSIILSTMMDNRIEAIFSAPRLPAGAASRRERRGLEWNIISGLPFRRSMVYPVVVVVVVSFHLLRHRWL